MTTVLNILKIFGIAIAGIVGFILILFILMLLIPFRYRVKAGYEDKEIHAELKVFWVFRICRFWYEKLPDESQKGELRVFGISFMQLNGIKDAKTDKPEKDKGNNFKNKIRDIIRGIKEAPEGPVERLSAIQKKVTDPRWKPVLEDMLKRIRRIISDLAPIAGKGTLIFGTNDPVLTGKILEFLAILFPMYCEIIDVCPDFGGRYLYADIGLKGKIHFRRILFNGIMLIYSKKFRMLYKELMRLTNNEQTG